MACSANQLQTELSYVGLSVNCYKCKYLVRSADERIAGTADVDYVTDQVLLSIVRGQDGDLLRGIAEQSHVHEHRNTILCFCQILYTT